MPLVWAVHSPTPSYAFTHRLDVVARDNILYRSLLLIASGIQMAGPHLTAQSFQAALWNATFPNPPSTIMAGKVGFGGGSYAMTVDGAGMWYNPSAPSPMHDEAPGPVLRRRRHPEDVQQLAQEAEPPSIPPAAPAPDRRRHSLLPVEVLSFRYGAIMRHRKEVR